MDIIEKKWDFLGNDLVFPTQCFESFSEVLPSGMLVCFIISNPEKQGAFP